MTTGKFRLVQSNQMDELVQSLATTIDTIRERTQNGVFHRVDILVPNTLTGNYAKLALARHDGIAANISFNLLESYISTWLLDAHKDLKNYQLLDNNTLQIHIIDMLRNQEVLDQPELEPVKRYINGAGSHDSAADNRDVRIYQLASRLAGIFSHYAYSRKPMIAGWHRNEYTFDPEDTNNHAVEQWQRVLWTTLFDADNAVTIVCEKEDNNSKLMLLPHLFDVLTDDHLQAIGQIKKELLLFGFSSFGPAYREFFQKLSNYLDIHFWQFNPSQEFWHTTPTGRDDEAEFFDITDTDLDDFNLPLRLWGRVGRDTMAMAIELQTEMQQFYVEPSANSLLAQLQNNIFNGIPTKATQPTINIFGNDISVQFLKSKGIQRELEVVAHDIWQKLKADPSARFSDFAIMLPKKNDDEYYAHINTAFKGYHKLPYTIVGRRSTSHSQVYPAIEQLLKLPFGSFKRDELMRILIHQNVHANFPDIETDKWIQWCSNANIFHGLNRDSHEGTFINARASENDTPRDLYNWDQGLKRILLGSYLSAEKSKVKEFYNHQTELGAIDYIPEEISQSDQISAAQFITMARSMAHDAHWLKSQTMTIKDWSECLIDYIDTYITSDPSDITQMVQQAGELALFRHALAQIGDSAANSHKVPYRIICLLALDVLNDLESTNDDSLIKNVIVGPIEILQYIPFKHVYLVGMNEGNFPVLPRPQQMDLRQSRWQPGDVWSDDRDRYAFLQTLMNTRDTLNFSWVAFESSTGETIEPASVISEFIGWIQDLGVNDEQLRKLTHEFSLRRYQPIIDDNTPTPFDNLIDEHPEAAIEYTLSLLREKILSHCDQNGLPLPDRQTILATLQAQNTEDHNNLRLLLKDFDQSHPHTANAVLSQQNATDTSTGEGSLPRFKMSLSRITSFLKDPLQGIAKQHIGSTDDSDPLVNNIEPFTCTRLDEAIILKNTFTQALAIGLNNIDGNKPLETLYDAEIQRLELTGKLPTGYFQDKARRAHLSTLEKWHANIGNAIANIDDEQAIFYGIGAESDLVSTESYLPPLELELDLKSQFFDEFCHPNRPSKLVVTLSGVAEGILPLSNKFISVDLGTSRQKDVNFIEKGLNAYTSFLAMTALKGENNFPHVRTIPTQALIINASAPPKTKNAKTKCYTEFEFDDISPQQARTHLQELIGAILFPRETYLIPMSVITDYLNDTKPFQHVLGDALDDEHRQFYGPIRDYHRYDAPINPEQWIERHYPYFLSLLEHLQNRQENLEQTTTEMTHRNQLEPAE